MLDDAAPTPRTTPRTLVEDQLLLDDLVDVGAQFIRDMRDLPQIIEQDRARDYDLVMRSLRRSILLKHRLAAEQLASRPDGRVDMRVAARARVIRTVEDAIQLRAEREQVEHLRTELLERLEDPDMDWEFDNRPTDEIITDIVRDMGLVFSLDAPRYARRTPADIVRLRAQAREPERPRALPDPSPTPRNWPPPRAPSQ